MHMPSNVINLRHARKQKARAEKAANAARNRALHGRTKADRRRDEAEEERAARALDGARRESDDKA